jgi:hypothetical protein
MEIRHSKARKNTKSNNEFKINKICEAVTPIAMHRILVSALWKSSRKMYVLSELIVVIFLRKT